MPRKHHKGSKPLEETHPEIANELLDRVAEGMPAWKAAEGMGLSKAAGTNIVRRNRGELDARREKTWPEFSRLLKEKISLALKSLTADKLEEATVKDIAVMTGIFFDKALAIDGQPSSIHRIEIDDRRSVPGVLAALKAELERRGNHKMLCPEEQVVDGEAVTLSNSMDGM